MAKFILENTRPHDITLHATLKEQVASVTIPAAKENPDDRTKMINGRAEADVDFVAAAKKFAVVRHYFNEGWLRPVSDDAGTAKAKDAGDADKKSAA